jgi:hypothetical protein
MSQKELFINSIDLIDVHGSTNIPTVLHYKAGAPTVIGSAALSRAEEREEINEDFKVDLGAYQPGSLKRRFAAADGTFKSAGDLTADFGVVVRIEQVSSAVPLGSFQRSHIPANANNSPSLTSKQYGCLTLSALCRVETVCRDEAPSKL